jgi:hypothetical protein
VLVLVYWVGIYRVNQQRVLLKRRLLHSNEPLKQPLKKPVSVLLVSPVGLDHLSSPQAQMGVLAGLGTPYRLRCWRCKIVSWGWLVKG